MNMRMLIVVAASVLLVTACSKESKQIAVCIEDVKKGLNDPNSFELLESREINMDNGWYRVGLEYTAKNAMGGRVRGDALCGFKSKDDVALNPDDFVNQMREVSRTLGKLRR